MNYNFERFNSFNSRSSDVSANISTNNAVNFSSGFGEANPASKLRYAVLYYDKKSKTIGVKFTDNIAEQSRFAVGKKKSSSGVSIIAHSFFKKNAIDTKKYRQCKYTPSKISLRSVGVMESGSMFVINLEDPISKGD